MVTGPTVSAQRTPDPRGWWNPENLRNPTWGRTMIAEGRLNPEAFGGSTGTVTRTEASTRTGVTALGTGARTGKQFTLNPNLPKFVPNPRFGLEMNSEESGRPITGETELVEGVPLGTFVGGTSGTVDSTALPQTVLSVLYRYLTVQAEILKAARSRPEFSGHRIVVEEGVYAYQDVELEGQDDMAYLMSRGRAIGYVVKTIEGGRTSHEKTFQLAEYLVGYPFYEKIILSYQNYYNSPFAQSEGGGDGGICVFVVLPELDETYNGNWARQKQTMINGRVQSQSIMMMTGV